MQGGVFDAALGHGHWLSEPGSVSLGDKKAWWDTAIERLAIRLAMFIEFVPGTRERVAHWTGHVAGDARQRWPGRLLGVHGLAARTARLPFGEEGSEGRHGCTLHRIRAGEF